MGFQTFQDNPQTVLVLDTSVLINLNACGHAEQVLTSLKGNCIAAAQVENELKIGSAKGHEDGQMFGSLVSAGLVSVEDLPEACADTYFSLTGGTTASSLDDGEAATIALALERDAVAVIDEKKALNQCARRFPDLVTASSAELFLNGNVRRKLGQGRLSKAVFEALTKGRMRVPPELLQPISELVGPDKAAQCRSLPKRLRARA